MSGVIINQLKELFRNRPDIAFEVNGGHVLDRRGSADPERIYYIISRQDKTAGLFSYYFTALSHIIYALSRSWVPVVNMRDGYYYLCHDDEGQAGRINVWDLYFEQPGRSSLDDVLHAANVIEAKTVWAYDRELNFSLMDPGNPLYEICRVFSDHVPLNSTLGNYCKNVQMRTLERPVETIGISYRSTYDKFKPLGHFVQPSLDVLIGETDRLLSSNIFNYIFLATEDSSAVDLFVRRYGADKVFTVDRPRVGGGVSVAKTSGVDDRIFSGVFNGLNSSEFIEGVRFDRENDKYKVACEYISEMHILSKCGGLMGARSNGTMYAYLMNGGRYKYTNLPTERYSPGGM